MVENGYTEYNTAAAALQRGQMIDIYIFVLFCSSPQSTSTLLHIVSSAIFGETYKHKSYAAVCYWTNFICLYKDVYLEWNHFVYSLLKDSGGNYM
jgi:hypothetical protein